MTGSLSTERNKACNYIDCHNLSLAQTRSMPAIWNALQRPVRQAGHSRCANTHAGRQAQKTGGPTHPDVPCFGPLAVPPKRLAPHVCGVPQGSWALDRRHAQTWLVSSFHGWALSRSPNKRRPFGRPFGWGVGQAGRHTAPAPVQAHWLPQLLSLLNPH